jgi:hypothetical protein
MTNSPHRYSGWEASDIVPLSYSPEVKREKVTIDSSDDPNRPEITDPNASTALVTTLREIHEALGLIGEVRGQCKLCPTRFRGSLDEFKVTIIINKGDGDDNPEVITLCKACYIDSGFPAPDPEDDHESKRVKFMSDQGATQIAIKDALGISQSKVSRILSRLKGSPPPTYKQ